MTSLDDIKANIQKTYEDIKTGENNTFLSNIVKLQNYFANYLIEALKQRNYHENNEISKYIKWNTYKYVDDERLQNRLLKTLGEDISFELQREKRKEKIKELWFNGIETLKDLINFYENQAKKPYKRLNKINFSINNEIINRPEIQEIINNVRLNRSWNTDYAIRYVVVMISRLVKRDVNFFFSSDEEKLKALNTKTYSDYPNVICKTLSELIRDVLYLLWIESKVIVSTNTKVPLYAIIAEWEESRYYIDALYDLTCSQYRIQPYCYSSHRPSKNSIIDPNKLKLTELDPDYIRDIDINTGLIPGEYFSDHINNIKNRFTEYNKAETFFDTKDHDQLLIKKFEFISDHLVNKFPLEWPIERTILYIYFRRYLLNKAERWNVFIGNTIEDNNHVFIKITQNNWLNLIFEECKQDWKYSLKQKSGIFWHKK